MENPMISKNKLKFKDPTHQESKTGWHHAEHIRLVYRAAKALGEAETFLHQRGELTDTAALLPQDFPGPAASFGGSE